MTTKPKVLIINSYGGSLVQAATQARLDILGSYEDAGYGLEIQQANFPKLHTLATTPEWPQQKLTDACAIAHPPCAPFSVQTFAGATARNQRAGVSPHIGLDHPKLQQTKDVLHYALGSKCLFLAVESVCGAMAGLQKIHDDCAKKYGYHVFRILQNAATFNLPQWRPRFWILFFRKDLLQELRVSHRAQFRSIGQLMEETPGSKDPDPGTLKDFEKQMTQMESQKISRRFIQGLMDGDTYGPLSKILMRDHPNLVGHRKDEYAVARIYMHVVFIAKVTRLLHPSGYTSTLMYDSCWACQGRLLSTNELKAVTGFPPEYDFPGKYALRVREFLSRGVCVPVAQWVLETALANLEGRTLKPKTKEPGLAWNVVLKPGDVADFRINKKQWPWRI